ncbi:helix-turn-helix transcriptional regulator [Streptomyces chumphonensis]|uniref:Helix-turn-helix transcriptional regulator n=1 Tax=Streptomyces chumphonensis TaxID=1214925 RepID=A0A927F2K5_9ACTN|nr:helix-turn-helix transcriptional regulator [Streptomyces chumphonensis]MBD3934076.1 helix-turn-helix transcriptional regulator [Streptomyces chumphonensis]
MAAGTDDNAAARSASGGREPEASDSLKAFGEVVKAFRRRAGLTQEEFARRVLYSVQMVASIEQGRRFPPATFVERAEEVLDAFGALRGAARHLSRRPGLASWFREWARMETEAISLYTYECRLIPGLLQTEAYARALYADHLPPLGDDDIEAQWTVRADRQRLLHERPNTAFSFIVEEHLFKRRTGGVEVTGQLLDHVLEIGGLRNVEVQVMPEVSESHAGLHGPMRLAEAPDNKWFAYCEGQEIGHFITTAKLISTLHMRYARMRSQALSLADSKSLLQRMRGALRT